MIDFLSTKRILFVVVVFWGAKLSAECPPERRVPGEYLVRLNSQMSTQKLAASRWRQIKSSAEQTRTLFKGTTSLGFHSLGAESPAKLIHLVHHDIDPDDIEDLAKDPEILSIEHDCYMEAYAVPTDTLYGQQWAHQVIQSEQAWDITQGNEQIIVAISDSGVDYNHPDLAGNMWVNLAEQGGLPGVDDDNNGCIDDIYGCDFANDDGDPRPGTESSAPHGTHVAGLVGAVGNNGLGVAGVAWNIKLMVVKGFFDNQVGTTLSALLGTIYYSVDMGARVLNCSWGGQGTPSQAERDAFDYARNNNVLAVVAAGNDNLNANQFTPASIPNVFTVAATNSRDQIAVFSNYGSIVDIAAPGGDFGQGGGLDETLMSTTPTSFGSYEGQRGTSMAAPIVAGVAALVLSINPNLTVDELEDLLVDSGDDITVNPPGGPTYNYKRVNAYRAVQMALDSLPDNGSADNGSQAGPDTGSPGSGLGEAVNDGMGGCGAMEPVGRENQSSLWSRLLLFLILAIPMLMGGVILRKDN